MGNPFFNRFQGQPNFPQPFQNAANLVSQFKQFRESFQGDPKEQVQQLLNSGKMTQEQFNQLSNMASQFKSML